MRFFDVSGVEIYGRVTKVLFYLSDEERVSFGLRAFGTVRSDRTDYHKILHSLQSRTKTKTSIEASKNIDHKKLKGRSVLKHRPLGYGMSSHDYLSFIIHYETEKGI